MADSTARPTDAGPLGVGVRELRYLGAGLAALVAGIHLLHPQFGAPRLLAYLRVGTLFDPRPALFAASGFLVVFGITLVFNGLYVRWVYLLGVGLVGTFLLGYVVWHTALDHGAFWPYIESQGHTDIGTFEAVWLHLAGDRVAVVSKAAELALLAVLLALYRFDAAADADVDA